ncbi:MAG: hypothetical protein PWQ57_1344 [Desulfovibrionales bacterium]|jgi:uncharacterized membrane protein YjjB (DUF3815 family)|nr:hypothetical protein [Desulfovibrionales bacterium]
MDAVIDVVVKAVFGAVASVGFAILFNAPPPTLRWTAAAGALGLGLRALLMKAGISIELATLLAATTVSAFTFWPHRRLTLPTHIFSIPGVINMVPGGFAFKAMTGFMKYAGNSDPETFFTAWRNGLTTFYILLAIAFGLVLPSLFLRIDKRTL